MLHRPPHKAMITPEMVRTWVTEGRRPGGEKTYIKIKRGTRKGCVGFILSATFGKLWNNVPYVESVEYQLDTNRTYWAGSYEFDWDFDATEPLRVKPQDLPMAVLQDRLGREIKIDDFISWARGGEIALGKVTKITNAGTITATTLGGGTLSIPNNRNGKAKNILILSNDLRDVLMLHKLSGDK